ncbi:hypothetical protein CFC21_050731 [Triticum aestivum]|uniref:DUF4220 domain-containing protein n=2 Tax=Triticum aestivum TaxID=4565 RepID=A0A9R1G4N2_WHEAT|nr:hypothetical protein CFC21_050731 [Triticum aestivum]
MANVTECSHSAVTNFIRGVNAQLWRSNTLMAANAVLVLIMVAISASGRHYRQVGVTRFVFQGATVLYLPIISYVVSSIGKYNTRGLDMYCYGEYNVVMLLIWAVLVQIVGTNTSATVAIDDDDGQKLGPSIELLARAVWTSYLVFYYLHHHYLIMPSITFHYKSFIQRHYLWNFLIVLCVLSFAKITLKFYAFEKARRSFALGRNSRLVAGYMEQLLGENHQGSENELIPPLIVMGEEKQEIEETPHGYTIKQRKNSLVTINKVWQMADNNDILLARRPWLTNLCLSFALFKLLKHQFAKCHLVVLGSTKAFNFVLNVLLNKRNPETVFRVIANEVSFILDSYYSSLPTSNFGRLLPVLNIIVSLSIITWCLLAMAKTAYLSDPSVTHQIYCEPSCVLPMENRFYSNYNQLYLGNILFNSLPTYSLFVVVILAEAWDIISYFCSNWFKVTLLCSYVTHVSWQQSPCMQRLLALVLPFKIKFIKNYWTDKMGQASLPAQPQPKKCVFTQPFFYFFGLRPRLQHVNVSSDVKASIIDTLKNSNNCLSKGTTALLNNGIGNHVLWACEEQDTSHVILVWHIATGIFEARYGASTGCSAEKNTTMHLSRYCVYLMESTPELLPPDKAWSKKLYKIVSEDIKRALPGGSMSVEYGSMVELLGGESRHEVVNKGARLGKQLVELVQDEETGWHILASFWSELILYVAPSHNIKAHKKARANGTELVTLIWALLRHAEIDRPNTQAVV